MQQAAMAYAQTAQKTVHPRELEASLLVKCAAKLQKLIDDQETNRHAWHDAIQYNRQLWVVFATAATREDSPLPDMIKQNIANLAIFIFRQSLSASSKRDEASIRPIININRNIAAGLRGQA